MYAANRANPIDATQAQTWSTLGLMAENPQLRGSTYLLVVAVQASDQSKVRAELGVAAGISTTMKIGSGPGFVPNTGT